MKLHYYSENASLYIEFKPFPGIETREIVGGLDVDLDAEGVVVGPRRRPFVEFTGAFTSRGRVVAPGTGGRLGKRLGVRA
ncbi:MAG: DUF2283 domain-containing protein [bacterium]|nr:DUF2283 domain-containing protein [bacterium]